MSHAAAREHSEGAYVGEEEQPAGVTVEAADMRDVRVSEVDEAWTRHVRVMYGSCMDRAGSGC